MRPLFQYDCPKNREVRTQTQGEDLVTTEADTGAMLPQAKDTGGHQTLEGARRPLPWRLRRGVVPF